MHTPRGMGFTLLEMLLAVVVLSMVGVLVATMLSQAGELSADNERRDASLTITRVTRLMNEQWSDRRSTVSMGGSGQTYMASPTDLGFVTTRAILNKDWPLVRARYVIVPDAASAVEDERRFDLVYEEVRLFGAGDAVGFGRTRDGEDADAQAAREPDPERVWEGADRHVLLRGCTEMKMERYRSVEQAAEEAFGAEQRAGSSSSRSRAQDRAAASEEEQSRMQELLEESSAGWVLFEDVSALPPAAVRITGKYEGEPFGCVFVGAALR